MIVNLDELKEIAEIEFEDIVVDVLISDLNAMRIILRDGSYLDIWYSLKLPNRYSYHWERGHINGKIYRHDNAPHHKWKKVKTFPKHFHNGIENIVTESYISDNPPRALREVLLFIRQKL